MSSIQVGGKFSRGGRTRIERPFAGVIAGLSVNKLRILDLAVERDPHITIRGDVQLVTGVLDRNDLQRMQQVREFILNNQTCKLFKSQVFSSQISLAVTKKIVFINQSIFLLSYMNK